MPSNSESMKQGTSTQVGGGVCVWCDVCVEWCVCGTVWVWCGVVCVCVYKGLMKKWYLGRGGGEKRRNQHKLRPVCLSCGHRGDQALGAEPEELCGKCRAQGRPALHPRIRAVWVARPTTWTILSTTYKSLLIPLSWFSTLLSIQASSPGQSDYNLQFCWQLTALNVSKLTSKFSPGTS